MALLSSLLVAHAMAGEPLSTEDHLSQQVAEPVPAALTEAVRDGLADALPRLLSQASRDCGVDLVRSRGDGSDVLAVRVPFGKLRCVDSSLASHTIAFADPDSDWQVKAACTVSAARAPTFPHPLYFGQHQTAAFHCTFPQTKDPSD